jgi:serine/threonine protein kinase
LERTGLVAEKAAAMIDDDADAAHRRALASTAADAEGDPLTTRVPGADDPYMTRAEAVSTTLPDAVGGSTSGRASAAGPRFRILRAHARGGIGEVFVALDAELRREVALKEVQDHHADDPRSRARFLLEAEVTGSLEHPGIVPVYGLGYHPDGRPYYAMRFIRGDSLKEAVDRHHLAGKGATRPDPVARSLELKKHLSKFVDICNAMAYAHSRGVLHRDLKPANVMLGPYGEVLVVDWGLAKWLARPETADPWAEQSGSESGSESCSASSGSCETVAGSVVGTPAFMSPEQAVGDLDRLGPASDIYSLGATLYYMLTGQTPFEGLGVLARSAATFLGPWRRSA